MNIHVVQKKVNGEWVPHSAHWSAWEAAEEQGYVIKYRDTDARIYTVELYPLAYLVNDYFRYRKYAEPNTDQAFKFLVSELGELSDALVEEQDEWVRNDPERDRDVFHEAGDILMMLTKFIDTRSTDTDPIEMMVEKMKKVADFDPENEFTMLRYYGSDKT